MPGDAGQVNDSRMTGIKGDRVHHGQPAFNRV